MGLGFRVEGLGFRVVVKIMVPFWLPIIIRHLIYIYIYIGYPRRDHNFDSRPHEPEDRGSYTPYHDYFLKVYESYTLYYYSPY